MHIQQIYVSYVKGGGLLAQVHFYVPERLASELRERAQANGLSLSWYVAKLVCRELEHDWPDSYFDTVVGGWKGDPLERPPQGDYETRGSL